jgi:shikimate kinase
MLERKDSRAPEAASYRLRSAVRINILGASGVGKTTLGRALAEQLAVPHIDSDDYFHVQTDPPYKVQRAPEERCALLERDLARFDRWILAGGAAAWMPAPALTYTLHVFMSLSSELRLERLKERERAL